MYIKGNQHYHAHDTAVEGDFSQFAFFAVMAAINHDLDILGVRHDSDVYKRQIVDLTTLKTLPRRHYYNGLAEAVKEGLIADPELFELFEKHDADFQNNEPDEVLEEIITRSLIVKKKVVEADEKEANLRKRCV